MCAHLFVRTKCGCSKFSRICDFIIVWRVRCLRQCNLTRTAIFRLIFVSYVGVWLLPDLALLLFHVV